MGDPKKLRKKYSTPVHPWNKGDIDRAKAIRREFGLSVRKEVLIADSFLKKYKDIAKRLIADTSKQGVLEKKQMMDKLNRLGLLSTVAELDQVLSLTIQDVLNRRIQSVTYRMGLARSMKQARQFIVHRHITLDGKDITSPSYLLSVEEESKLKFKDKSALSDENHPERVQEIPEVEAPKSEAVAEGKGAKTETPKEEVKAESKPEEKKATKKEVKKEVKTEEAKAEVKEEAKTVETIESKDSGSSDKPAEPKVEKAPKEEVKPEAKTETPKEEVKEEIKE
jgi:small subunit ribosomal protein S4